jgi:hypothetical protein
MEFDAESEGQDETRKDNGVRSEENVVGDRQTNLSSSPGRKCLSGPIGLR